MVKGDGTNNALVIEGANGLVKGNIEWDGAEHNTLVKELMHWWRSASCGLKKRDWDEAIPKLGKFGAFSTWSIDFAFIHIYH